MTNSSLAIFSRIPTEVHFEVLKWITDNESKAKLSLSCKNFHEIVEGFKGFLKEGYQTEQTALIETVARRGLTPEESVQCGTPILQCDLPQIHYIERELAVEQALNAFYEAFKRRCLQLNVKLSVYDFLNYALLAIHELKKQSGDTPIEEFKIDCFVKMLCKDIFADESIAMQNFDRNAKGIGRFFSSVIDVEGILREALKTNADEAFNALASEFLDLNAENPRVAEIQVQLQDNLEMEKVAIDVELARMRGSSGQNGTLGEFHEKLQNAILAEFDAGIEFRRQYSIIYDIEPTPLIEDQMALDLTSAPKTLQETQAAFVVAHSEWIAADKEINDLNSRFFELIQLDHNRQIIGGKFVQVREDLANVSMTARAEAMRIGRFYQKLRAQLTSILPGA